MKTTRKTIPLKDYRVIMIATPRGQGQKDRGNKHGVVCYVTARHKRQAKENGAIKFRLLGSITKEMEKIFRLKFTAEQIKM